MHIVFNAENIKAHLFEQPVLREPTRKIKISTGKKERPEHRKSWEKRLEWVNPPVRELVSALVSRIEKEFSDVVHFPKHRWYYVHRATRKTSSRFAVLMINKKEIEVRLKADTQFKDSKSWTKSYKGWFFYKQGEEKGFKISDTNQIDYAMKLVRQSYELAQ